MPLLDHFASPLGDDWPWDGFHGTWAAAIAAHLNADLLPPEYYAVPLVKRGGQVEIDVATFGRNGGSGGTTGSAVATAVWAPPRPVRLGPLDFVSLDLFEVQIVQRVGGPQLRATIELISPANRDGPATRRAFAIKCASYLQRGISVVTIDVVTHRLANLHAELLDVLRLTETPPWESPTHLAGVAYRTAPVGEQQELQFWPHVLTLGAPLPTVPLWLEADLSLPLPLEETYSAACRSLRIPT